MFFFSRILAVVSRRRQAAAMSESTNPAHVPKSNRAEFKRFRRAGGCEGLFVAGLCMNSAAWGEFEPQPHSSAEKLKRWEYFDCRPLPLVLYLLFVFPWCSPGPRDEDL